MVQRRSTIIIREMVITPHRLNSKAHQPWETTSVSTPTQQHQHHHLETSIEKSVGLKSAQEYKDLLKAETLELEEGLEHEYKIQLQDDTTKIESSMKEVECAVSTLEDTISNLEEELSSKNDVIDT